ncbi:hypothetical protein [Pseudomonas sp. NA-150]
MSQFIQSQAPASASVQRSAVLMPAQIALDAMVAPVDFYYGYWFSHWRA